MGNRACSESGSVPGRLLLQWHITERCNLECTHCYQEAPPPRDLAWAALMEVLEQFRALRHGIAALGGGRPVRSHINITGGEPLVHPDATTFLETIARARSEWSFAVLSNGTMIDNSFARCLAALGPAFVQVSIDGSEATHDRIRGSGAFSRAAYGIRSLTRHGIPVLIAFTASRENYLEFPEVARLGRRLGVARVWADRLVPLGRAGLGAVLDPGETRSLVESMRREKSHGWPRGRCTEIAMHRALQFAGDGGMPYRCEAGRELLTVLANGDICPCRRMPVVAGNVTRDRLSDVYWNSEVFRRLRETRTAPAGCEACFFSKTCAGGLRCLSAAVHGDSFVADPGCWLKRDEPTLGVDLEWEDPKEEAVSSGWNGGKL